MSRSDFPADFLWGTAISSYQIDGGFSDDGRPINDWALAELRGLVPVCSRGIDHQNRYHSDLQIAAKMGLNAWRFSIEWGRIMPDPTIIDGQELTRVQDYLRHLKSLGFTTIATLWHFTLPAWAASCGGWRNPKTVSWFTKYAKLCAEEFGDLVDYWSPLNEPSVYVPEALLLGHWPPFSHDPARALISALNLRKAHEQSYEAIKQVLPTSRVGPVNHYNDFTARWSFLTPAAKAAKILVRSIFDNPVRGHQDWIGVNYYQSAQIGLGVKSQATEGRTDLGWGVHPRGLYQVLVDVSQKFPGVPIIITENGLACNRSDDIGRWHFIREHLAAAHLALKAGVDLRGYMHWSLFDNYEWAHGFEPRFGLVAVDYDTLQRRPRYSARLFTEWLSN